MRLTSKILGFVLGKALLAGAMVLLLFLGYLLMSTLIPNLQSAEGDRDRLEEVVEEQEILRDDLDESRSAYEQGRAEAQRRAIESLSARVDAEIDRYETSVSNQTSRIQRLRHDRAEACGFVRKSVESLPFVPNTCEAARKAVGAADKTLRTLERNLDEAEHAAAVLSDPSLTNEQKLNELGVEADLALDALREREIQNKQAQLNDLETEEKGLREAQESWAGWVVNQWAQAPWNWFLGIVLLALLAPVLLRTVGYFLLMPLVSRAQQPMRLSADTEHATATLHTSPAKRTLPIGLSAGEVLSARSEYVRPVRGRIRSRLLYDWTAPFISFAAGLYGLSRISGDEDGTEATLATPDDPNSYLMRIDFTDHPGVVMHPKHVVGVMGAPELTTRWRWGIQSLATWQVRYIMFTGTGSLIVQGSGDVVATNPGDRSTKMEQHLMMGFDSRLTARVSRTEVFWPYLWGKTPLVDDEFAGRYPLFWQKSSSGGPNNPIVKTFNAVFSAVGKLLGF